ncbi:helix-turn-helix domain-containing protein [Sphingomonas sanguinis]|uniref:helix-turn-helix domain-containing protein n=1 Tax=Sphingomonas sanguinis TaxID=33051 RepID=UPI00077BC2C1|nr:helix-turn-helix transcriptional regulator [Sphingomonas sanguinis]
MPLRLVDWRKKKGLTQGQLADAIDVSQSYISQIERSKNPVVPNPAVMERIYRFTAGEVEPNSFYDMPRWRRMLDAALAALARAA